MSKDYDTWYNEVEISVWGLLFTNMDVYEDVNFEAIFASGMEPYNVAEYLYLREYTDETTG